MLRSQFAQHEQVQGRLHGARAHRREVPGQRREVRDAGGDQRVQFRLVVRRRRVSGSRQALPPAQDSVVVRSTWYCRYSEARQVRPDRERRAELPGHRVDVRREPEHIQPERP
ncbi:hypothetical protein CTI14_39755, partial [Methylobacterium radiotolerans]